MTDHVDSQTGEKVDYLDSTGRAENVTQATQAAGERDIDTAAISSVATRRENRMTLLTVAGGGLIGVQSANTTRLSKIIITTMLVGTITISGFYDDAGAAVDIIIPAATPPTVLDFDDVINEAGALKVTLNNGTDNRDVQVVWRAA